MSRSRSVGTGLVGACTALAILACTLFNVATPNQAAAPNTPVPAQAAVPTIEPPVAAATVAVTHLMRPSGPPGGGTLVYDVVCKDTAAERRAPYGDSYNINRLSRPFLQDMTYVPDLDILTYTVSSDSTWWFVSIELVGGNPNNAMGINYGVELDQDHDGFGDYLILAHPPYGAEWDTAPVQIFQDTNHNTGGLSGEKSDAPLPADGYETLIFHGGAGDADPDLAWVRTNAGSQATVQFAFKKAWSGVVFMLGTLADAGLKDPKMMDYVDRFVIAEAGSPIRENPNYPLRALYAFDNGCREAFGFVATGYEPQLCPRAEPEATKKPKPPTAVGPCQPPSGGCGMHSEWHGDPECRCVEVLY
ncbi:MAG TPA: hypothetical protein VFH29_08840 [Anaerolineales bacterium]|nr:hypothetical protein [Anaerolineales bacterium]